MDLQNQEVEKWIQDSDLERKDFKSFSQKFWQKIQQELLMEILIEKKPLKKLKLYEIDPQDLNIDLEEVSAWSIQNENLYYDLLENGFADFICNKEYLKEMYIELFFEDLHITEMDSELKQIVNLEVLKLSNNYIQKVQNIPQKLRELYLFQNQITQISPKIKSENLVFLGLGYNNLNDQALNTIGFQFPNLMCLDLCYNNLTQIDITIENLQPLKSLKMLTTYGNPISLLPNYYKGMMHAFENLIFFDEIKVKEKSKQKETISFYIQEENPYNQQQAQNNQDIFDNNDKPDFEQLNNQVGQSITQFTLKCQAAVLENPKGIILDKDKFEPEFIEKNPAIHFATHYWLKIQISKEICIQTEKISFESLYKDQDEKVRIGFEFEDLKIFEIEDQTRDIIRKGFYVSLHQSEPVLLLNEETEEKEPVLDENGVPTITESCLGVCRIETNRWLKETKEKRLMEFKYKLFPEAVKTLPEFWVPVENEDLLLSQNTTLIEELIKKRQEELKPSEDVENQEATGGNKKDAKKKDAKKKDAKKKDAKKDTKKKGGKDEPVVEEKTVPLLDWPVYQRENIFVDEKEIHLSIYDPLLLCLSVEIVE